MRELPQAEWPRLKGTALGVRIQYHDPADVVITVVEDADNNIVGIWSAIRVVQLEGVWIAPTHRRSGNVARKLMRATFEAARRFSTWMAFTGAADDYVAALLVKHLDARPLNYQGFVVPLKPLTEFTECPPPSR